MEGQTDKMDHSQEEDEEERVQKGGGGEKSEGVKGQMWVSGGGCTSDNALSYSFFFYLRSFFLNTLCLCHFFGFHKKSIFLFFLFYCISPLSLSCTRLH